jgi:hypothetical protein
VGIRPGIAPDDDLGIPAPIIPGIPPDIIGPMPGIIPGIPGIPGIPEPIMPPVAAVAPGALLPVFLVRPNSLLPASAANRPRAVTI